MAEYIREDAPERVATTVYGINLLLCSFLVSVLWRFAVRVLRHWSSVPDGS